MDNLRMAVAGLIQTVRAAIKAGDWNVDGACDPEIDIQRVRQALATKNSSEVNQEIEQALEKDADDWYEKTLWGAQPEQEPVAWMQVDQPELYVKDFKDEVRGYTIPLYAAPPKQEFVCSTGLCHYKHWVGLTDEELSEIYNKNYDDYVSENIGIVDFLMIAGAVEATLKEKNS